MGFSRQGYWSGLLFPPPEDLPDPGIESAPPASSAFQAGSFPLVSPENPSLVGIGPKWVAPVLP